MTGRVIVAKEGTLATVTLSHRAKFNAMSRGMWRELRAAFAALQADAGCRCIVLQGEGGHFCAGGDIAEYPEFRFDPAGLRAFHEEDVWGGLQAVLACDVPVIAAIEGNCMGAGVEIASCCDLRIAGEGAKFGAPIAKLGFPMAPREAAVVVAAAGDATVREMLLEAAVFPAAEMLRRGFLHAVHADDAAAAAAHQRAQRIAALAPQAARMNKRTLRAVAAHDASAMDALAAGAYAYAPGEEHREGIAAFLEKRQPEF